MYHQHQIFLEYKWWGSWVCQWWKGLRQGDPLSPLIFVLCMEYLSRILKYVGGLNNFEYHPRCEQMKLTHLCFTDDFMFFCKGDPTSVSPMIRGLYTFSLTFGLEGNKEKSAIYFGNVKPQTKEHITSLTGFNEGTLPFRYLGISIAAKRISAADCECLVDKINAIIKCWGSRHLSYTAIVQLINLILMSLYTYWVTIFILPQSILKFVIAICRSFVWDGKDKTCRVSPIAMGFYQ